MGDVVCNFLWHLVQYVSENNESNSSKNNKFNILDSSVCMDYPQKLCMIFGKLI